MMIMDRTLVPYARLTGASLLVMAAAAIFAHMFVRTALVVPGDAVETVNNIRAAEGLFRAGIASFLLVFVLDIVVAWGLYIVLRPAGRNLALLAAFFRLAMGAALLINMLTHRVALHLATGAEYLGALGEGQAEAMAMLFLDAHAYGFSFGLVFFGFHCLLVGYLVFRSGYFPRVLGLLMGLAGASYLFDSLAGLLWPEVAELAGTAVIVAGMAGELLLMFWLLAMAGRMQRKYAALHA